MKKIRAILLFILSAFLICSCDTENDSIEMHNGNVVMTGIVTEILDDRIAILVTDDFYKDQTMHVLVNDNTPFVFSDGTISKRSCVNVGATIKALYSGQIMLSLPGQISAQKIIIKL